MEPRIVTYRYGHRGPPIERDAQWWPVYEHPPPSYGPLVIGGTCPPDMHVGRVTGGWSCVPGGAFGAVGQDSELAPTATAGQLATTMVLRGAVGTLIGAAVAPKGSEGVWGAAGFVMGATLGEIGIVGVALAALWRKA